MEKELIKKLGLKVKNREITWQQASEIFNEQTNSNLSNEAIRKRFANLKDSCVPINTTGEFETIYKDGIIEAQKIVNLPPKIKEKPEEVLKVLGYNPDEWEMVYITFSNWQQHTKKQTTKDLYAVKFKLKPTIKELTTTDYLEVAKEVFSKEIEPIKLSKQIKNKELDDNLMIEYPAIELHLGKLAWHGETGQNYDYKIAIERFNATIEETIKIQDIAKAGTLFMVIGNDFFNSDTASYTTTKGTPQHNDLRWKKMFLIGLELYTKALLILREKFNKIDIQLCQGNHDEMASFYLYIALQQYFKDDDVINFSNDFKKTQCYLFGKCTIFTNHGDTNLKRLIKSIPAEFYEEWGKSLYRELHLGHLHKEVVVDDESGMITRRIGSPTGTNEWHYSERYVGAVQKHQLFLWHKEKGLLTCQYIPFDMNKKKLIKRL